MLESNVFSEELLELLELLELDDPSDG